MNMRRWYYALAPPSIPIDAFIIATGLSLNGRKNNRILAKLFQFGILAKSDFALSFSWYENGWSLFL